MNTRPMLAKCAPAVLLLAALGLRYGAVAAEPAVEYELKAALLYKVAKFVRWPMSAFADDDSPLVFCVLGDDPFGSSFDAIAGRDTGGRSIVLQRHERADQASDCHLVFISASESDRLSGILRILEYRAVLTVGDTDDFAMRGGAINLVVQENRIAFEINAPATERAGLEVSSQLMRLARIIG